MGIFDFFKKQPATPQSKVPVTPVYDGKHGDRWSALLGWQRFDDDPTMVRSAVEEILQEGELKVDLGDKKIIVLDYPDFEWIMLVDGTKMASAFPWVRTDLQLPCTSRSIKEWAHVQGIEAQVEASGKNTFGLLYFATDYMQNKQRYQNEPDLKIALSGLIYGATAPTLPAGFAPNYAGYMPHPEQGIYSVIDFVGEVRAVRSVSVPQFGIQGYVVRLNLINGNVEEGQDAHFFLIDAYVDHASLQVPSVNVGDRLSGAMWLAGKIVD